MTATNTRIITLTLELKYTNDVRTRYDMFGSYGRFPYSEKIEKAIPKTIKRDVTIDILEFDYTEDLEDFDAYFKKSISIDRVENLFTNLNDWSRSYKNLKCELSENTLTNYFSEFYNYFMEIRNKEVNNIEYLYKIVNKMLKILKELKIELENVKDGTLRYVEVR